LLKWNLLEIYLMFDLYSFYDTIGVKNIKDFP